MTMKDNSPHDCRGCTLLGRREFLRDAAFAAAALAALGATAGAMPVSMMHALAVTDEQATYPLPATDGVYIDKKQEVIVARVGNQVFAFELACPHQNTALRWNDKVHEFQCPKHHSRYKPDGTFITGRATRNMDRFAVTRQGNSLVVDLDKVFEQDKDAAGWKAAAVTV
ncbi:MAG: ubiquinol-cytochrome c reductase iron-sulfur subunit [Gemmatimonadaceae bacterium]